MQQQRNVCDPVRRAWRLLLTAAALAIFGMHGAQAQEVIHSFDALVQVATDGTLNVTETIRVRAEGREIKRGIYRDFPLYFRDPSGARREVTFSLIDVKRDGRPEPHFTRSQNNGIRIYAGAEDVLLRRGDYTYEITYRTGRQLRWVTEDQPELYWNVTGNFWNFPIREARVRVELPGGARPERYTAYTGRIGERGTDWRGTVEPTGALLVSTARTLRPGEGLTIVAALPAGVVAAPSASQRLWWALLDQRRWILGVIGFALVLGYYAWAWSAVGRDPRGGTIIPLFHPPKGVSPALSNYVQNWGLSRDKWRAFTAAALSLAVRGLIRFDEDGGTLRLKTTGSEPAAATVLPPGERTIFNWVKGQGGSALIGSDNGSAVATVASSFTSAIEDENKHKFFRYNLGYVIAGLAMTVAVFAGVLVFGGLAEADFGLLVVMMFLGIVLGLFIVPVLRALFTAARFKSLIRAAITLVMLGVFSSFLVSMLASLFPDGLSGLLPMVTWLVSENPFPFALVGGFAALNGLFLYLMRAPTALGRPIMDQLEGLKLYLETAESARLNLGAPEITAERFERLLPYAVALDVEKPWADAFAAALSRAHPGEADPMNHYRPAWRTGGANWSGSSFGRSMALTVSGVSSAFSSAMPAPSSGSSGFSSGGGSGGGGGGGGGGGW